MDDLISVVIPAYNVAGYIEKCLESVLSQTHRALQVIVVNDGSTDGTAQLIQNYTGDERVLFLDQKNAGVTAARNAGIARATGDYLALVDSDDWLEPAMYEKLLDALAQSDADVAVCDYDLVYPDHTDGCYSGMRDAVLQVAGNEAPYFYRYCAGPRPNNYLWTRLYRTELVQQAGVRFEPYKLGDDTLFNFKLLPFIKSVASIPGGYYHYLQRPESNVYTVAKKGNLAAVYADTFEALARHYEEKGRAFLQVLPIHAYTRLRSVLFYSRLAGMGEDEIAAGIAAGFAGRTILRYLEDTSGVEEYARVNGFSAERAAGICRVMETAVRAPEQLAGVKAE